MKKNVLRCVFCGASQYDKALATLFSSATICGDCAQTAINELAKLPAGQNGEPVALNTATTAPQPIPCTPTA